MPVEMRTCGAPDRPTPAGSGDAPRDVLAHQLEALKIAATNGPTSELSLAAGQARSLAALIPRAAARAALLEATAALEAAHRAYDKHEAACGRWNRFFDSIWPDHPRYGELIESKRAELRMHSDECRRYRERASAAISRAIERA